MDNLPAPSQKVRLVVLDRSLSEAYSTFVEFMTPQVLCLATPIAGGRPVAFSPGQPVRVEYNCKGARLWFVTRVIDSVEDRVPLLRLEVPGPADVRRFPGRDFFRQEASLDLTFRVLSSPEPSLVSGTVYESRTRDISASGAQILCPDQYPAGTRLDMHLDLKGTALHLLGEVIRSVQPAGRERWWVGVRFLGLTDRERDQIVRCIYQIQQDLRRRGL